MDAIKKVPDMKYLEKQKEWLYEWKEKLRQRSEWIIKMKKSIK